MFRSGPSTEAAMVSLYDLRSRSKISSVSTRGRANSANLRSEDDNDIRINNAIHPLPTPRFSPRSDLLKANAVMSEASGL